MGLVPPEGWRRDAQNGTRCADVNEVLAGLLFDGSLMYWYWWLPGRRRRLELYRRMAQRAAEDLRWEIAATLQSRTREFWPTGQVSYRQRFPTMSSEPGVYRPDLERDR